MTKQSSPASDVTVPVAALDLEPIKARVACMPVGAMETEDLTDELDDEERRYYWKDCPHGCREDDCVGHFERRVCAVDGLHDVFVDDSGYFSPLRAAFLSAAAVDVRVLLAEVEALRARLAAVEGQE